MLLGTKNLKDLRQNVQIHDIQKVEWGQEKLVLVLQRAQDLVDPLRYLARWEREQVTVIADASSRRLLSGR